MATSRNSRTTFQKIKSILKMKISFYFKKITHNMHDGRDGWILMA